MSKQYRGPEELPVAIVDRFTIGKAAPSGVRASADDGLGRRRPGFTLRRVTLPSTDADGSIGFEYYDVDTKTPTPVVLVLPIFNGQPIVTRYFARYFANQGWAAIAVDRDHDPLENLSQPEEAIRESLIDYKHVLDWVATQPDLDPDRIGLFGISFGAMDAVMLTALDDRIDALVAAMAGGDYAYLLMNTNYRRVARTIDGMVEESGLSREALRALLDARISTDPLALGPYVDASRVLMVLTRRDVIVPYEAQEALYTRIGAPEALYLPTGHRMSIVFFPRVRSSAFEFFSKQFTVDRDPTLTAEQPR
jgi:pimeloyl-ACP methyl ester carboxylesterase